MDIQIEQKVHLLAGWMAPLHTERSKVAIWVSELGTVIREARRAAAVLGTALP